MSDDRKALWPWIVALLIGLPVLYVASFGPAARLAEAGLISDDVLSIIYTPLGMAVSACPEWVGKALASYLDFWGIDLDI
jgi:hypothetical protein